MPLNQQITNTNEHCQPRVDSLIKFLTLMLVLTVPLLLYANEPNPPSVIFGGEKIQGGLVVGQTQPGNQVLFKNKKLRVSEKGYFLLGFGRGEQSPARITVTSSSGKRMTFYVEISPRSYKEERIFGLSKNKVQPNQKDLKRIRREQQYFNNARMIDDSRTDFLQKFIWPVEGRISGVYGSRRILNNSPKRPHYGLDIAAPLGTPVIAPADGKVTINQPDLFYTGVTIMLDHGHGLSTLYIHLDKSNVRLGDFVKQGDIIGTVGKTGRATGPHLHWGMSLFNTRLDPRLMVE